MRIDEAGVVVESLDTAFRFLKIAACVVLILILLSGVTYVKPGEVALVLRFGRLVGGTTAEQVHGPGLLLAWPYLIDQVIRVPVKRVQVAQLTAFSGDETSETSTGTGTPPLEVESQVDFNGFTETLDPTAVGYCVTGDRNIVHARVTIKFMISDPVDYALRIHDVPALLLNAVADALTQSIGSDKVDSVLAEGKRALSLEVASRSQKTLDDAHSGISIVAIEFKEIKPPDAVAADFKDVVNAYVEKQTKVQEARAYREKQLPAAEAERWSLIRDAQAFSADRIARAQGEIVTFKNLYAQYKANPNVERERLYYEAVDKILNKSGARVVVPQNGGHSRVLIPGEPADASTPNQSTGSAAPATSGSQ